MAVRRFTARQPLNPDLDIVAVAIVSTRQFNDASQKAVVI